MDRKESPFSQEKVEVKHLFSPFIAYLLLFYACWIGWVYMIYPPVERETYTGGVRKITYRDPDGNEIGLGGAPL